MNPSDEMDSEMDGQSHHGLLEGNDAIVSRLAKQDKVPWYNKPNLRFLYLVLFPTCIGVDMTDGFDSSMINGLQAVPSWLEYYHHPRSTSLGLMIAMYSLGSIAAVPFAAVIVDKIGRRYSILWASIIATMGAILQGSALNFMMFVIARFILGSTHIFCIVAASSLVGELSHPKERAIIGGLSNASYYIGALAAAGVTIETYAMTSNWGWRIPSFLQALPSLLQVSFIWLLPESPRWLVSKGRGNEAYRILVKYHAEGDEHSEFVKAEYAQIEQTLGAELKSARRGWKVMFSTPGMRRRYNIAVLLGLFSQCSGIGLITYLLTPILDSIGIHDNRMKNIINLTRVSWNFVIGMAIVLVAPQYPRRRMFLASGISLFVVSTAWTVASAEYSVTHSKVSALAVLVLILLYNPAYDLGFTALTYEWTEMSTAYLVELFPFHARASGIAVSKGWNRCMAFLLQFLNPIAIDAAGWRWYIVYCVWNAVQVVLIYLMFPETAGRTLEELTSLYEDDWDTLGHGGARILCEQGATETYDTVEDRPRRMVDDEWVDELFYDSRDE